MAKFVIILVAAAIIESIGVALLKWGLDDLQGVREITVSEIVRVAKSGVTNVKIIGGVALEAVFFGALLYMMSTRAVSLVWPLTSLGFIFTTLAAQFILHEKVTATRWAGVLLIAIGAGLTGYSEAVKELTAPQPTNSTPFRSQ
jgi:drug/metabolite transporter (DMT)-like permease